MLENSEQRDEGLHVSHHARVTFRTMGRWLLGWFRGRTDQVPLYRGQTCGRPETPKWMIRLGGHCSFGFLLQVEPWPPRCHCEFARCLACWPLPHSLWLLLASTRIVSASQLAHITHFSPPLFLYTTFIHDAHAMSSPIVAATIPSAAPHTSATPSAPAFNNANLVFNVDIFLLAFVCLFLLLALPRAVIRFSHSSEWFDGQLLHYVTVKPRHVPPPRRQTRLSRICLPLADLDGLAQ